MARIEPVGTNNSLTSKGNTRGVFMVSVISLIEEANAKLFVASAGNCINTDRHWEHIS